MLKDARAPALRAGETAALFAVSVALCVGVALAEGLSENAFGNMGWVHYHLAANVLDGRGFGRDWFGELVPDLFARPTYTLFLCPAVAAIGRHFETLRAVVAVMQGSLIALTALATASIVARTGARGAARVAAWLVVLHPVLISQGATLVDTALFAAAFIGAYAVAAAVPREAPAWRWGVAGLVLGVAVLTRSTAWMLAPAIVLMIRRIAGSRAEALRAAALVGLGTVVVLAPWFARNHALTDRWMLSTVDGVNLWMGNNADTARFLDEDRSLDELPGRAAFDSSRQPTVAAQVASCDAARDAAWRFMRENPGEAAALTARKAGDFWAPIPTPRSTRSTAGRLKDLVGVLWTIPLYVFAALGFIAAWRARGASRALAVDVGVTCLLFTLPHAVAWGGTRLRAPLDPFLAAIAAIGVVAVWTRFRKSG